jgi:Ser/Thr protein kinase RdoA (MazF antagonist)
VSTVVLKLPALDPAAVFTSTVLRMYEREVTFFNDLAHEAPVRVPDCHYAAFDASSNAFAVVMEDMGDLRVVDQIEGMALREAERAVDELAAWHAAWWDRGDDLATAGATVSLADPIYPAVLPLVFAEGWEKLTNGIDLSKTVLAVGERFSNAIGQLLTDLAHAPTTMLHGDFRADNILLAGDGSIALLDFQLIGSGSAAYDLAYFVTQSLDAEVASIHERALFDQWVEGLRGRGVNADRDQLWEDYRKAALFCLVYPVVASRGMDLDDPRQHGLLSIMSSRLGRAIEELGLDASI